MFLALEKSTVEKKSQKLKKTIAKKNLLDIVTTVLVMGA